MSSSQPSEVGAPSFYSSTGGSPAPPPRGEGEGTSYDAPVVHPAGGPPAVTWTSGAVPVALGRPGSAWRHPGRWPLRAKIVVAMVTLFTLVTLVTGAASVVALRGYLYQQLDAQLLGSIQAMQDGRGVPGTLNTSCQTDGDFRGPGNDGLTAFRSFDQSISLGCVSDANNNRQPLTTAQLGEIFAAGLGRPTNLDLGGTVGTMRLVAVQASLNDRANLTSTPGTAVVGLPVATVERTLTRMTIVALIGVLGGLVVVVLIGTFIVRRSLRPLDRMAATATRISTLPLDRGHVDLGERVPDADADPRTEVGQVGRALNEMIDHIDSALTARQQSEERVRQFVADASHELRTPLASIRGYAELTRREPEPVPASVQHAIGRIESEGKRMGSLVEDLLLLARLDAGRPLESTTVDLSEMVINAVGDAHVAAPDHVWQLDLPDEPVEVQGDQPRLHQIIANLLANARTHTDPGTVVHVGLSRVGDRVRIAVHDNGPGVPPQLQANVFQRFARGDTSRNRAGGSTGLGLSIVAAVAAAHGGSVELASKPGDTTFAVYLPAATA